MTLLVTLAVLLAVLTPLLWVAAVLLGVQTYRAPENVPVRILALGITLLAIITVLRDADGGRWLSLLASNTFGALIGTVQLVFFISVERGRAGVRRIYGEFAVALAICAAATAVYLLAPGPIRESITDSTPSTGGTYALLFVLLIMFYVAYVTLMTVYWISRIQPGVRRRVLRFSLWLIAAGAVAQFAATGVKVGQSVDRYLTGSADWPIDPDVALGVLIIFGSLALVVGALVPIADGAVREIPRIRAQRRAKRALDPLWRALHAEFPELELELRSPGPGRALYRRVVEIRDGLVLLSPHFDRSVADRAARRSREAGEDAEAREISVQAALVRGALDARRAGDPVPEEAARLGSPAGDADTRNWQDDAAALVRLACRFEEASAAA